MSDQTITIPPEKDAYTPDEFCARNAISKSKLYELWRNGRGPEVMKDAQWVRISKEAAAEWRQRLTAPHDELDRGSIYTATHPAQPHPDGAPRHRRW